MPWRHTSTLFWHAINGSTQEGISLEELDEIRSKSTTDLGAGGKVLEWKTSVGVIREEILKYGLHDVIMGNPAVTLAVMRIISEEP